MTERRHEPRHPRRRRTPEPRESGVHQRFEQTDREPGVTLSELTAVLIASLDYRSTLRELARVVVSRVAHACVIELRRPSPSRVEESRSLDGAALATLLDPSIERVMATGECTVVGVGSSPVAVVAPIRTREETIGAIAIVGETDGVGLSRADAAELGRRVGIAVHNGQLYEAAVAATRMRDEMLSTVSHDLKNPLGIILLSAARLLGAPGPESDRHPIEVIERSAKRMRGLVADLLDVEALDAGAMSVHPSRCDVRALVDDAIDSFSALATDAGVSLRADVPEEAPDIWADAGRVGQVLANVISNAIKFTPRGGEVTLSVRALPDAVAFSVADNGIGISENDLPHIFDRFWQANGARKLGSGLGLAICKSLVELSGGSIRVESALDKGTVMTFTLPIAHRASSTPRG